MAGHEASDSDSATSSTLQSSRSSLRAAMKPVEAASTGFRAIGPESKLFSTASVAEGVERWWGTSAATKSIRQWAPLVESCLRVIARRHYPALLIGSAAAGAAASLFPGRTLRSILKIAGPVVLSGVLIEIAKASARQRR